MLSSEQNEYLVRNRKVIVFDQFESKHTETAKNLRSLKLSNFIVLTTKEGAIAVDYQGTSVAHPIITYGTQNNS